MVKFKMSATYMVSRISRRVMPVFQQKRFESTTASLTEDEMFRFLRPPVTKWSNIEKEAEKIVGHPTSFMNMKCLLTDEFSNMTSNLRKRAGSDHLIIQTAKKILYGNLKNFQPWGLITLLLAKSVKSNSTCLQAKKIEEQQLSLVHLTEMMRNGHLIHKGIVNVPVAKTYKDSESALLGNKIAVMLGDYLVATAYNMLAGIRNSELYYIISTALKDLTVSEFFGERDEQNMPLPGKPTKCGEDFQIALDTTSIRINDVIGKPKTEWTARNIFNGVSLLGRSCQAVMILNKQNKDMQNYAYYFGCNVGLAWQAATELQQLTCKNEEQFCLVSAPVLFALDVNPDLYKIIEQAKNNINVVDYGNLKLNILKTDAVERTKKLYEDHAKKATEYIENLGQNESVDLIKKMINTI